MVIVETLFRSLTLLAVAASSLSLPAQDSNTWWSAKVTAALARSRENRGELEKALRTAPTEHRSELAFLLEHMPPTDLRSLKAGFLLENVALAKSVMKKVPWGDKIPRDLFLNDVLPYANVSETRESWRRDFQERFLPLVKDCRTPGEAAQVLNRKIFGILKVRYSTKRRRADQSPSESIDIGVASCTGLSIILTDACRAVGVPARMAGIPRWVNKRGNHTWVEVWDERWHFTGAAEASRHGLDHAWFERDAALARADVKEHSIYAVSYKKTGTTFPMVWARRADPVSAVNVTARYTKKAAAPGKSRLMIRVRERVGGVRVIAEVEVAPRTNPRMVQAGKSKGEQSDTNDFLDFEIDPKLAYVIRVRGLGRTRVVGHRPNGSDEELVEIFLTSAADPRIEKAAAAWFAASVAERKTWRFDGELEASLKNDESAARRAVWNAFRRAPLHAEMRKNYAAKKVQAGGHESPYTVKSVGVRPAGGWPLFIAMHGGGGVPKRVNDSQWRHMQIYYRDQKSVKGYKYVALRAPNDSWNGFYTHYVWPLVSRLVQQFTVCGDVDPNRVFLMGYSHGGYGAFAIGANIPDRFAAVHASAAAPTPGITPAVNLRNVTFTFMIGERDTRYGRLDRCRSFAAEILKLRGARTDIFPVTMEFKKGNGHGGLPDRDKIKNMYSATRRATPREITWRTTGSAVRGFYWLSLPNPVGGQRIEASCKDNVVAVQTESTKSLHIGVDSRLVDFAKPILLRANGEESELRLTPSLAMLCESMLQRGDPDLAYTARIVVEGSK